jgi:hypothetical protein
MQPPGLSLVMPAWQSLMWRARLSLVMPVEQSLVMRARHSLVWLAEQSLVWRARLRAELLRVRPMALRRSRIQSL